MWHRMGWRSSTPRRSSARWRRGQNAKSSWRLENLARSEGDTSELQSHRDLHSFPTRRSSDLCGTGWAGGPARRGGHRPAGGEGKTQSRVGGWKTWPDRKGTRLNSSPTEIYTLSLHDALPIYVAPDGLEVQHAAAVIGPLEARAKRKVELAAGKPG